MTDSLIFLRKRIAPLALGQDRKDSRREQIRTRRQVVSQFENQFVDAPLQPYIFMAARRDGLYLTAFLAVFCQRAFAAFLAIAARRSSAREAARALAPFKPAFRAASGIVLSSTSPVAIRMTWTALPITCRRGAYSPLGPVGIRVA